MSNYIKLTNNGILFPSWLLKNFKKYKLDEIKATDDDDDVCSNLTNKIELTKYQKFISSFLNYNSIYKNLLLFHGLGSGKTITTINVYNCLYKYTPYWNIIILLKASLKEPWLQDLTKFLKDDSEKNNKINNIYFVSYDAPNADKLYFDINKHLNISNKTMYIIDEVHNFITNVYNNVVEKKGNKAKSIYDDILKKKEDDNSIRVILLTATPIINNPFELSLIFNLLRKNIFPKNESDFNDLYIDNMGYINPSMKNNFQRRIIGLVSYYKSNNPEYFASHSENIVYVNMSSYQYKYYKQYRNIEKKIKIQYKAITRQASNFIFPYMEQGYDADNRHNQTKYADDLSKELGLYISKFKKYLEKYYNKSNIENDIINFKKSKDYRDYINNYTMSSFLNILNDCSSKMIAIIYNIFKSPGPVIVYSNYVMGEGIEIFKIYLNQFGFFKYESDDKNNNFNYLEFHGNITEKIRQQNITIFNKKENIYGSIVKIFLLSSAGSEGISLLNIRQIHIMEPHWHETRVIQVIGRGVRLCSHRYLPKKDRHVDVYRYISIHPENTTKTTDASIHNTSKNKQKVIDSFLNVLKEVAIDCKLNKNHNMYLEKFKCFDFEQDSLFAKQKSPAYKEDIIDDLRINNGLNNPKSYMKTIKVYKIKAVIKIDSYKYSEENEYWYDIESRVVYDIDVQYPVGKLLLDKYKIPEKTDKNQYIITNLIHIPIINHIDI